MKAFLGLVVLLSFLSFSFEAKSQMKKINDKVLHEKVENIYNVYLKLKSNEVVDSLTKRDAPFHFGIYASNKENLKHLKLFSLKPNKCFEEEYGLFCEKVYDSFVKIYAKELTKKLENEDKDFMYRMLRINAKCLKSLDYDTSKNTTDKEIVSTCQKELVKSEYITEY